MRIIFMLVVEPKSVDGDIAAWTGTAPQNSKGGSPLAVFVSPLKRRV